MNKLSILLKNIKSEIKQNREVFFVVVFALLVIAPIGYAALGTKENPEDKDETAQVLGTKSEAIKATPTLTPTLTPRPTTIPRARIVSTATPIPTPTSSVSSNSSSNSSTTPTPPPPPSSTSDSTPTNTPIPTPTSTPTITPTITPTPTPNGLNIQINIDYAGQKPSDSYTMIVNPGQTAWEAVRAAIGIENLQYADYGGDLGIFISGFNGIAAASNQYYEFRINGTSSNVGVSSYTCNNEDKLEFVLTTF